MKGAVALIVIRKKKSLGNLFWNQQLSEYLKKGLETPFQNEGNIICRLTFLKSNQ